MTLTNGTMRIRACRESDISAIHEILAYYVLNTVINLALEPASQEEVEHCWRKSMDQNLPYIVAVDAESDVLIGFCYAGEFRGERRGYRHTVEISLFCHPDHVKRRVGSKLLQKLLEILKTPDEFPDLVHGRREEGDNIRAVLACMSVDETAWNKGLGLRDFYVKHGFEEVGHLKKVGHKFDKWVDTRYLQLSLW